MWHLFAAALILGIIDVWAQRFMYRRPAIGMPLRYVLGLAYALLCGAAIAAGGVPIHTAVWVAALITGIQYGFVCFDALIIFGT